MTTRRSTSHVPYDVFSLREILHTAFPEGLVIPDHTPTEHWYKNTRTGSRAASVTTKQNVVAKGYLKQWAVNKGIDHISANIERLKSGDTSVLDEAKFAHENELGAAGQTGTNAHGAIDKFCIEWIERGTKPSLSAASFLREGAPGQEVAACRSFDKFISEVEVVPVASELKVWYEKGKDCFAGTVDAVLLINEVYKEREGSKDCDHDYSPQTKSLWCTKCGREVVQKLILGDWKTSNQIQKKDEYAEQTVAYATAIEVGTGLKFDDIYVIRFEKSRADYEMARVADRRHAWQRYLATSRLYDLHAKSRESLLVPLHEKIKFSI